MKRNRMSDAPWRQAFFRQFLAATLLACSLQFSLLAQNPETDAAAEANVQASGNAAEAAAETTATSASENSGPARINVVDIVSSAPSAAAVPATPPVPAHIPAVVAAYLPVRDTNVGIGIFYPPGDPHFPYLVAGIRPPGGDPRLPPETPAPVVETVVPSAPLVYYERPEWGSKAVAMRTSEADQVKTFPPGAFLYRPAGVVPAGAVSAREPLPRGALYFRQPTTDEKGKDLVWNFPPGAALVRTAPASTGR